MLVSQITAGMERARVGRSSIIKLINQRNAGAFDHVLVDQEHL